MTYRLSWTGGGWRTRGGVDASPSVVEAQPEGLGALPARTGAEAMSARHVAAASCADDRLQVRLRPVPAR